MPGMHAQPTHQGQTSRSGPLRWGHTQLERARAAFGALRSAAERRVGEPPADDTPATSAAHADPVTVIPVAGARPTPASRFAEQWHAGRGLLARLRRPSPQSGAPSQAQPQAPVPLLPAPWFRAARRWSPGLFPPALALALFGALALIGHLAGRGPDILPPADVLPLAIIYLIGGTLFGIALYFAPTNNIWLGLVAGGAVLYVLATLWVLAGPLAVAAVAVLLAVPVYFYVRHHLHTVPAGQAVVTTLAGGYHRTLAPGTTVLVPGERTLAAVETGDRQLSLPSQRVRLTDPDGEGFVARAAATLAYHLTPDQAHLAALASGDWEHDLRQQAVESVRTALAQWGRRLLDGEELPERFLARTALDDLRPRARPIGVTILWVNVRDIWLTPESEVIPVAEWEDVDAAPADDGIAGAEDITDPTGRASSGASSGASGDAYQNWPPAQTADQRPSPAPASASAPAPTAAGALPPIDDALSMLGNSEPLEREALTPEALADAYDAVRDGQIADPATIREIARAFMAVAAEAELAESFPFNAAAAAQILMERATALERAGMGRGNQSY